MGKRNILVVYSAFPTRATLLDALYSFGRYAGENVFYLNLRLKNVPWYVRTVKFDLIIFQTTYFSKRYDSSAFRRVMTRASVLAGLDAVKVMLPQDEYINADVVNEFIIRFGITIIFSVQPEYEWPAIYGSVDRLRLKIFRVLTGCLDEARLAKIKRMLGRVGPRRIDIGYRTTGPPPPWFGRHGFLKQQIADVFVPKAQQLGLKCDISTSAGDTLLGNDWYRFLCRCKYTLGVDGGTSILDRDGSIKRKTEEYCARHPSASFEEIENACFPGLDGTFRGYAISPRHLEACVAGVCQLLTEGSYNGILLPGKHYIEVKRDFSNVDDVLETIRRDDLRKEIVERAYDDIVVSGKYTYRSFVNFVIERSIGTSVSSNGVLASRTLWVSIVYYWMRCLELRDRLIAFAHGHLFTPLRQWLTGR